MNKLPLTRHHEIIVQELGDEILVYDLKIHRAYSLNKTSAIVYRACFNSSNSGNNGQNTFADLKSQHALTDEIIFLALDELKRENLLEESPAYQSPFAKMTRREAIRKVGLTTAVAIILPAISALNAPAAAAASSGVCLKGNDPADPIGVIGTGGNCTCATNVGVGNSCGRGDTLDPSVTCKAGCTCTAANCSGAGCTGTCG